MTSRSWSRSHRRSDGAVVVHEYEELNSGNSPRVNGLLTLRANTMTHVKAKVITWSESGAYVGENSYSANSSAAVAGLPSHQLRRDKAQQTAYSRLRGKLYKGNASLGVTFASWRQSRDMIVNRSNLIRASAEEIASLSSRRKLTRRAADDYLEIIFGWKPLIQDIYSACLTVVQTADKTDYVRARGSEDFDFVTTYERPGWNYEKVRYVGTVRCTMATGVRITNPNLWLAERAGLINLAAVAWDIVPFSFLVNMVSNVGSLVNSISDFCGLGFVNSSYTWNTTMTRHISYSSTYPRIGSKGQSDVITVKDRILASPAPPRSLIFRPPNLDWETAAMAASLMVQQSLPVLRLIGRFKRLSKTYTE